MHMKFTTSFEILETVVRRKIRNNLKSYVNPLTFTSTRGKVQKSQRPNFPRVRDAATCQAFKSFDILVLEEVVVTMVEKKLNKFTLKGWKFTLKGNVYTTLKK